MRILLFVLTNFAILIVASVTLRLLGIEPWLDANGINFNSLLIFGAVLGFGGAFLSLAMSKWTAKRMMGVQVIANPRNEHEAWLVETVRRQAGQAGIGMPEVGYFDSPAPNAFATGARRDKALVAVSTGLLQRMSRSEVEAVLGHEVSHVANGDMVTLTLIQGVVNTFVFVASRLIGNVVDKVVFRNERGHGPAFWITTIVARARARLPRHDDRHVVLAPARVPRRRRRRPPRRAGSSMIGALQALGRVHGEALPEKMAAFGISGRRGEGLQRLFMSHPPIEERIAALQAHRGLSRRRGAARRSVRCRHDPSRHVAVRDDRCAQGHPRDRRLARRGRPTARRSRPISAACTAGTTPLVALPDSTARVAELVGYCARERIAIVPQGGNTSYCGGATPRPAGNEILLSLRRLRSIRAVDAAERLADGGSRLRARRAAGRRRRGEPPAADVARIRRQRHARRHRLHQCRRHGGPALRHDARAGARPRGRAARRARARPAVRPAQGQHGLRPQAALHRRRGHARRRDGRDAAPVSAARRRARPPSSR